LLLHPFALNPTKNEFLSPFACQLLPFVSVPEVTSILQVSLPQVESEVLSDAAVRIHVFELKAFLPIRTSISAFFLIPSF
jgi:hypothetical protein